MLHLITTMQLILLLLRYWHKHSYLASILNVFALVSQWMCVLQQLGFAGSNVGVSAMLVLVCITVASWWLLWGCEEVNLLHGERAMKVRFCVGHSQGERRTLWWLTTWLAYVQQCYGIARQGLMMVHLRGYELQQSNCVLPYVILIL